MNSSVRSPFPDPSSLPLIELQNLVPGYAKNAVFNPLNLSLNKNELVCLLGPNGSGKSTLLRTIADLQGALSGDVVFRSPDAASQLAVVLTDPVRVSNMTVRELITYGRYPYLNWNIRLLDSDRIIIEESIDRVNLRDLADRPLDELSDGQRQMVMIARALAQDTGVLLLDEPTAHLDLGNRVRIMRFLKTLAADSGKAILLATHELDLALQTADVLWVVQNRTITHGIPEDLILNGVLDDVFAIGGYDLSSGKIDHKVRKETFFAVSGGSLREQAWTKNALARNGIPVDDQHGTTIQIESSPKTSWRVNDRRHHSLKSLLDELNLSP